MTRNDGPQDGSDAAISASDSPAILTTRPQGSFSLLLEGIVDSFSSILVKESRQAIKSMQFLGTFSLLILAVATCTFVQLANVFEGATSEFSSGLLASYLVILGVPLAIIVPFSAFRSLAREYEDGTIQLVSITTMKPYQVVIGKLATALLQMAIYLSVVAPCVVLITFLDGVTVVQILLGFAIAVLGSFCFTVLGLLLAGVTRNRAIALGISTLFLLALGLLFVGWWSFVVDVLILEQEFRSTGQYPDVFYMICFVIAAFVLSTALVMLAAAASQISFPTDNRSTLPRIALTIQLVFFFAFVVMMAPMMVQEPLIAFLIFIIFIAHYWLIMGSMICGESGEISHRVLREMPKSFLGRSVWGLLMPGPGRGYLFTLACMMGCVFVVAVVSIYSDWFIINPDRWEFMMGMGGPVGGGGSMLSSLREESAFFLLVILYGAVILSFPAMFLSFNYLILTLVKQGLRHRFRGAGGPFLGLLSGFLIVFGCSVLAYYGETTFGDYGGKLSFFGAWNWYMVTAFLEGIRMDVMYNSNGVPFTYSEVLVQIMYRGSWLTAPFTVSATLTTAAIIVASREMKYGYARTPDRVVSDRLQERQGHRASEESIDDALGIQDEAAGPDANQA